MSSLKDLVGFYWKLGENGENDEYKRFRGFEVQEFAFCSCLPPSKEGVQRRHLMLMSQVSGRMQPGVPGRLQAEMGLPCSVRPLFYYPARGKPVTRKQAGRRRLSVSGVRWQSRIFTMAVLRWRQLAVHLFQNIKGKVQVLDERA